MPVAIKWGQDIETRTVDWLMKPFIPYGKVTIIQGDPGEGKTSFILAIAAMLSQGIQPPTMKDGKLYPADYRTNPVRIEPQNIFYASTEEEISDSALPSFLYSGGDRKRFACSAEKTLHMNLCEDDIREVIKQTDAKLVIIDPLQAFLPEGVSMNNVTRMRPVFTALSNVALETGAAIVLIGHVNKSENSKLIHRGLGSADISAAVRSIILVQKDENDHGLRIAQTIKSNFRECDYTPIGMRMENEQIYFVELGEDEEEEIILGRNRPIDIAMEFLEEKLADGPIESNEIKELLADEGISERTANRAKKALGIESVRENGAVLWELP